MLIVSVARSSPGQDGFTISKSHSVPRDGRSERSLQRDDFPHLIVTDAQLAARWNICRIWYSISRTVSDDGGHRGGMMVARSALSPSSPAPAARRKSGVGA